MADDQQVLDVVKFKIIHALTGDDFNKQVRLVLKDKMVPAEPYKCMHIKDTLHFFQFYWTVDGSVSLKTYLAGKVEDLRLIHESDYKAFNNKVEQAFKDGFKPGEPCTARASEGEIYFTMLMVKTKKQIVEVHQTIN